MNRHLQNIQDFIQQAEHLSAEEKTILLKSVKEADSAFAISEFKLERTEKVKRTTAILLEETIEELEQKRKAVEQQNRELEIESALERVRARTMAMQKSDDLAETASLLFKQISDLGIQTWTSGFNIWEKNDQSFIGYNPTPSGSITAPYQIPSTEDSFFRNIYEAKKRADDFFVFESGAESLAETYAYMKTLPVVKEVLHGIEDAGFQLPTFQVNHCAFFSQGFLLFITLKDSPDAHDIFKRFAKVFEQTYTRFLDLQKAEAQARESQIQLALERVRARTMAMQHSDELKDAAALLFQQAKALGVPAYSCGYNIWEKNEKTFTSWMSAQDGSLINGVSNIPLTEDANFIRYTRSKEKGEQFFVLELRGERMQEHYEYLKTIPAFKAYFDYAISVGFNLPETQIHHLANFLHGNLLFITLEPCPEFHEVFKRFAKVFEQTYTRFLDLQKAEAQAKEAEIALALERVRARTMAMQNSDELREAVLVINEQLQQLNFDSKACNIIIIDKETGDSQYWVSGFTKDVHPVSYNVPYLDHPYYEELLQPWKRGEQYVVYEYTAEGKKSFDKIFFTETGFKNVPEEAKNMMMKLPTVVLSTAFFSNGAIQVIGLESISDEKSIILQRFAKVFDQTYTRFLDLKKAEEQAKEAQIEAALERVRSRTMGMQKSDELKEVIQVVYDQFVHLKIHVEHTGFVMDYKARDDYDIWIADQLAVPSHVTIPYFDCVYYNRFNEAKRNGEDFFASNLDFEEKNRFYQKIIEYIPGLPEETKEFLFSIPGLAGSTVLLENVCLYIENFEGIPFTDEANDTLMRFGKVFQQTYTRFLDLQKAEAQARESQIEAALERTRTHSMLMQHSDELDITSRVFHEQLLLLGIETELSFVWLPDVEKGKHLFWTTWTEAENGSAISKSKSVVYNLDKTEPYTAECFRAWESGEPVHVYTVPADEVKTYLNIWNEVISGASKMKTEFFQNGLYYAEAFMKYGCFGIMVKRLLREDEKKILLRFTVEFERTYTRFLDLQKAEAQAREAQIEAALEKVRSRTLAMRTTKELGDVVVVIVEKLKDLDVVLDANGVILCTYFPESKNVLHWISSPDFSFAGSYLLPYFDHPIFRDAWASKNSGVDYFSKAFSIEEKNSFFEYAFEYSDYKNFPDEFKQWVFQNDKHTLSFAWQKNSAILIPSHTGIVPDEAQKEILKRFANVFEQAYIRFLDLQKAEAQARESQIEAALERVRSRTLAMHKSDELAETSAVLFQQLIQLGIEPNRLYINIIKDEAANAEFWITDEDGSKVSAAFESNMNDNSTFTKMYKGWNEKKKSLVIDMQGKELQEYFAYLSSIHVPFKDGLSQTRRVQQLAYFNNGFIGIASPDEQSEETIKLLERFAAVFNLTYTRFHDLQFAEAQTHKANIEVALERVRARALAMQQPEELVEVAEVMRHEMGLLGVEELETSSIYINKEKAGEAECWYSLKGVDGIEKNKVADHFNLNYNDTWVGRQMFEFNEADKKETSIIMQGENRKEWINYCAKQSPVFQGYYGEVIPGRTYHLCKFSNGAIGAATPAEISEESWELLRRAASVFSLAYSRFKDLTKARTDLQQLKEEKQRAETALTDLRSTQTQLIQAEKMASLGELTAGIAHEIQNPLNFVNNFSEVSNELIIEMNAELMKGDIEEAKGIAKDILQNLEKINHHGKRAADIVKGMLQHSRSSSATKESTDINKLVDEYLRLAYHGLRAKDKTFNAVLKTDFDKNVGSINIIPQDIGRVILNLITNAFYVVNEKKQQQLASYEPTVSVSTNKLSDKVEIRVKDNGNGIPGKVLEKIFQPFFTTKPTGQGTGLGLSLAYDIVKAHGGDLKVETLEGEGSEFIIQLPVV